VRDLLIPDVKSSDGHQILLASGYNKPKRGPRPEQSHACDARPIWTPWGWAVNPFAKDEPAGDSLLHRLGRLSSPVRGRQQILAVS